MYFVSVSLCIDIQFVSKHDPILTANFVSKYISHLRTEEESAAHLIIDEMTHVGPGTE